MFTGQDRWWLTCGGQHLGLFIIIIEHVEVLDPVQLVFLQCNANQVLCNLTYFNQGLNFFLVN